MATSHDTTHTSQPPAERTSLRVLLAEDNLLSQKILVRMLSRIGIQADVAATGNEVLAAWRCRPYDIILMDVHMPEMDGLEATRHIRATHDMPQPRIIALTAGMLEDERQECLVAGMDEYLIKPVELAVLRAAIEGGGEG